jgi:hypothetical protein
VCDGCDDGGDIDVISREGERARLLEDCELGEGVSSGGGGGGRTKWNVRDAICIWDLREPRVSLENIFGFGSAQTFHQAELVSRSPTTPRQPKHRFSQ